MLTRSIDQALEALTDCRERVPFLRDHYREGTPERAALTAALEAVDRAWDALTTWTANPPSVRP